jgi:peroxiredoxin
MNTFIDDERFVLFTISVQEERETVERFMREKGYSLAVLLDEDGFVSGQYDVRMHPMKVLIDTEGRVIGSAVGYREWYGEEMKALIRQLLSS